MDVFDLRQKLIRDYAEYIKSFIHIKDDRIHQYVDDELERGLLWPEPLLQLNPNFQPGAWIQDLVRDGVLHPKCADIFQLGKLGKEGPRPLRLHKHQSDAIQIAATGANYVLTTGTGSGKSLTYIIPIVNFVLQQGSGRGIRAIIVYPMNALANSQFNELKKFLQPDGAGTRPPVTFERYTGQERKQKRNEIIANPPDILLTNYVMLELMLTRPAERRLIESARGGLQFFVLDELHTYRGRQGSDVAMLVRRVRELFNAPDLQCVGTSATLSTEGTFEDQQRKIAEVAGKLFGAEVKPEHVIGESLERVTPEPALRDPDFVEALRRDLLDETWQPPTDYGAFRKVPLAAWIESTFGLQKDEGGRWVRAKPIAVGGEKGAARQLSQLTGVDESRCQKAIQTMLMTGYDARHPDTRFPIFAFRLHQFISRGDTVYASLEPPEQRHITTNAQRFVPNGKRDKVLLPVAFCRECGQEYYVVSRSIDEEGNAHFTPRDLNDYFKDEDEEKGFLYFSLDKPWPDNDDDAILDRLPDEWLEIHDDSVSIKRDRRKKLPQPVRVDSLGRGSEKGEKMHFIKAPFGFCLNCGVSYSGRTRSDFGKLSTLSSEGRSTATTILSLSTLKSLRDGKDLPKQAQKLLSFTDNRQDASLQAGHFNDFVEVGQLRAAIRKAVKDAGEEGMRHDVLPQRIFDALALPFEAYAVDPGLKFAAKRRTEEALREVLAYRVYQDLRRGWRVTSPNLEQTGLLKIEYESLEELCQANEEWQGLHPLLVAAEPETRAEIARTLLDHLRRELAIKVDYLDGTYQETIKQKSSQRLRDPWAIDEDEKLIHATIAFPRPQKPGDTREHIFISARGGFGQYLRRKGVLPHQGKRLSLDETAQIITDLFKALRVAGLVEVIVEDKEGNDLHGYQIPAAAFIWKPGDGKPFHDRIRVPRLPTTGARVNPFFFDFYGQEPAALHNFQAREHTAQVPNEKRLERERLFRKGDLPLLYCSPTMELGVDIAQLNAVNMRNVPPTPANYAQRSGRAGRSGQPALIFTYCTTGSPHDQYFFKRPELMVAGAVSPPRLDLGNEDLLKAHIHAIWLYESGLSLGKSLTDVLDVSGDHPTLELLPSVEDAVRDHRALMRTRERAERILAPLQPELANTNWYHDGWLDQVLAHIGDDLDRACKRWRELYRAATEQRERQHKIANDHTRSEKERNLARRLRAEAESQIDLLTETHNVMQSDFYSYRYFASEGFLPGYNFPRLPLSAYIPARRQKTSDDEYLNRPRFLAISEFGPRSIIYHEGSRYAVNRVILPPDQYSEEGELATGQAKLCSVCGYLHPITDAANPDVCEHCGAPLDTPLSSLFRMQNVSTRRRDRINSDEEERIRMGYEILTVVRFSKTGGRLKAQVQDVSGQPVMTLTYGPAATLWRINLGWRRRKDKEVKGFVLDIERGYWARNEQIDPDDPEDPMSRRTRRVVPYAEDHRNCLLIEPEPALLADMTPDDRTAFMASLQPALKNAIQVLYQLEDSELAAEPLPTRDDRRLILFYEAAEGGAGVLRQLFDDGDALARVARKALELAHFDPHTGEDLHRAPHAKENCDTACYDCLMSYYNQPDHELLDRHLVREFLLALSRSQVQIAAGGKTRAEHLADLLRQCDSDLEREWLRFLDAHNLRLPDQAQPLIEACHTRPDFLYTDDYVAIFIDGPKHDLPDIRARDEAINACLADLSYTVIRFSYDRRTWEKILDDHDYLFGNRS